MSTALEGKVLLKPNDFSDVSNEALLRIARTKKATWIVIQPLHPTYSGLLSLIPLGEKNVFIQTSFACSSNDIKEPAFDAQSVNFEVYPPPITDSTFEYYMENVDQYFLKPWHNKLLKEIDQWFRESIKAFRAVTSCIRYEINNQTVAFHSEFPYMDTFGTQVVQIGWIWIDANLSADQRRGVHKCFANYLKARSDSRYQSSIHILNLRSQRFFRKLGFEPVCANVYIPSLEY